MNEEEEKEEIEIIVEDDNESTTEGKIKKIKKELADCRKEKEEYLAGWQRSKADFINSRKDEEKRMEEFVKFSLKNIFSEFLSVADSLDMALKHSQNNDLVLIKNQLSEILKRNGVEEIEIKDNEKFDPQKHEALEEIVIEKKDDEGIVLEELQKGYTLFNRILRPSKVKVGVYKLV